MTLSLVPLGSHVTVVFGFQLRAKNEEFHMLTLWLPQLHIHVPFVVSISRRFGWDLYLVGGEVGVASMSN